MLIHGINSEKIYNDRNSITFMNAWLMFLLRLKCLWLSFWEKEEVSFIHVPFWNMDLPVFFLT